METKFPLIPLSEVDDLARSIAVAWCEEYGTMDFDIENKHKLASDIMNYHRHKVAALKEIIHDLEIAAEKLEKAKKALTDIRA